MPSIELFDHPAWVAAAATASGYALALLVLFLMLFVGPYLLFPL